MSDVFYVYVLFDHRGVPRYVGKGKGRRWLQHEQRPDPNNQRKNAFIAATIAAIGEVPKVKVRDQISEADAFEVEAAMIRAIGRHPKGPLVNLTDKRNGPTSETIKLWHASRSSEDRSATTRKARAAMSVQDNSSLGRNNALAQGRDALSARMSELQRSRSPEVRRAAARLGGQSTAATMSETHLTALHSGAERFWSSATPELKREIAARTGLAQLTSAQLSEAGKRGIRVANARRSPEERSALARKAGLARQQKRRDGISQQAQPPERPNPA